jgi:hypothetical protein
MIGRHASGRRLIPRSSENSTVTAYPGARRAAQRASAYRSRSRRHRQETGLISINHNVELFTQNNFLGFRLEFQEVAVRCTKARIVPTKSGFLIACRRLGLHGSECRST